MICFVSGKYDDGRQEESSRHDGDRRVENGEIRSDGR